LRAHTPAPKRTEGMRYTDIPASDSPGKCVLLTVSQGSGRENPDDKAYRDWA
jgi:hypothetical protein